ncbi:MAG: thiamine-monophosphate kinase [Phycisphaeraceae bacterium]|nr:thiamine-monophosphate kinase [Phycisphaeraceae bacterium]MBX3408200.1 thiamine-monophosphate kinase [Phycisphaeraceae bacterium]
MRENQLLAHIHARSADLVAAFGEVVVGPGDDCAVVRAGTGSLLLLTVDQLVEGRHFAADAAAAEIAHKAIARSISDIAAMGGTPAWALATGLLPRHYERADELFDAMSAAARQMGAPLVGGDIATWDGALALTCTVGGAPHPARGPVLRAGARPGDDLWVTGRIGGSLRSGRHLRFVPRTTIGAWLCDALGPALHAMIDISDGVGVDSARLAAASGIRAVIDLPRIPLHDGVVDPLAAIGEGEDYELLFAVAPGSALPPQAPDGTPLTRIGRCAEGSGCIALDSGGHEHDCAHRGWEHA